MKNIKSLLLLSAKQRKLCERLQAEQPRLRRMAYSWTHDMDIADDIVQEAMIKAVRYVDNVKDMRAIDGWMFRVLSNCFYDHCRKQKDTVDIDDCVLHDEHTPDSNNDRDEMLTGVRSAVSMLPVKHRQVVTLVDLEGMSYTEVAEALEVPIGTVMSRLNRARQKLRTLLEETGQEIPGRRAGPDEGHGEGKERNRTDLKVVK